MTHYDVLQIIPTASPEVVRMAYKALASKYHPDVFQGDKEFAEFKMKQINEAYRILSSPILRQEYDRTLQQASRTTAPSRPTQQQSYQSQQQTAQPKYTAQNSAKSNTETKSSFLPFFVIIAVMIMCIGLITTKDAPKSSTKSTTATQAATLSTTEATSPKPTLTPAKYIPKSGEILSGSAYTDGSELTIKSSSRTSCVVKLKTVSGVERLSFYVRPGETVTVGVPAERLYVYFAEGDVWYGKKNLFGEETYYSKDDELLDFTQYTFTFTLYPVTNGNFSETPIPADEF